MRRAPHFGWAFPTRYLVGVNALDPVCAGLRGGRGRVFLSPRPAAPRGDEAHTGVVARSILHSGLPSAFDGRNATVYDNGAQINGHLLYKQIPWSSGTSAPCRSRSSGTRPPGSRRVRPGRPPLLPAAVGGLVPARQATGVRRGPRPDRAAGGALPAERAVLSDPRPAPRVPRLAPLETKFKSAKARLASACVIFVLLFHTHPFAAVCTAAALGVFCLAFRRPDLPGYLGAAGLGFVSWIAWSALLGPPLAGTPLFQTGVAFSDFGAWCAAFFRGVLAMAVDLDAVGSLPLLLLAAVVGVLAFRSRGGLASLCREPLFGFALIGIAVQAAASAAVFGTETGSKFACCATCRSSSTWPCSAPSPASSRWTRRSPRRARVPALCAAAVACNLATCPIGAAFRGGRCRPPGRDGSIPRFSTRLRQAWDEVIATLRRGAPGKSGADRTIIALPPWTQVGDRLLPGGRLFRPAQIGHPVLDGIVRRRARPPSPAHAGGTGVQPARRPAGGVRHSLNLLGGAPRGFAAAALVPSFRARPDDGSRPELTRHTFAQAGPAAEIALYRLAGD